jgi:hypothetical protein
MPFCRKCGSEISTWMSFCPGCGASLTQSTTQPYRFGYRFISLYVPNALLWVFLVFLWMLQFNAYGYVTWYTQFTWLTFGLVAGLVIGIATIRRQLNSLTEKGEMGLSISYLLFIAGCLLVFAGIFLVAMFVFPGLSEIIYVTVLDTIMGAGISILFTQALLVVKWERNHKMRLYHKWWSFKIYAVPTPDTRDRQSTMSG